jgi:predicted O-methyltransferase YrrM
MFFQIRAYFKFLWHSKNEHAVHSPFVFNLITKCFYDKKSKPEYQILNHYRNILFKNKSIIDVNDFGAGSKVFKSNQRQISKIAKTAGISITRARLLFRLTQYHQPARILEIGTSLGLATSSLALGNKNATIITVEGCSTTASQCQLMLQKFDWNHVKSIISEFDIFLKTYNLKPEPINMIFFDGNHSKAATLRYFELLLPTICNDTVWIFDDIHWSKDMEHSWEIIKNHSQVTVSIDTFQWGIVYFRKEQNKQHFVIRV